MEQPAAENAKASSALPAQKPPESGAATALSLPRRRKRKTESREQEPRRQQSWFKRQMLRADEEDEDADSDEIAREPRKNDSELAAQTLENESHDLNSRVIGDQGPNVGCLTAAQRLAKVQSYLTKKAKRKAEGNKHIYKFRQQVATKRLRIRGRFVTRD